jgi:hypothetical protein
MYSFAVSGLLIPGKNDANIIREPAAIRSAMVMARNDDLSDPTDSVVNSKIPISRLNQISLKTPPGSFELSRLERQRSSTTRRQRQGEQACRLVQSVRVRAQGF